MIEKLEDMNLKYQKYLNKKENIDEIYQKEKKILEKNYYNVTKSIDKEFKSLSNEINKEKKQKLNLIEKKFKSLIQCREELIKNIYNCSTFDTHEIGKTLATLISAFEEKEYHYVDGPIDVTVLDFDEQYLVSRDTSYRVGLITASNNFYLNKKIVLYYPDKIKDKINPDDTLLYCSVDAIAKVSLYDDNGNFNFDERYPYVKDFIDILISNRMNNKTLDIDNELNSFILENKPKVKKITQKN